MRWPSTSVVLGFGFLAALMPRADAAPDNARGMALMGGRVLADGSLPYGSGIVANFWLGGGDYRLEFDRDVTQCIFSVTPESSSNLASAKVGYHYIPSLFLPTRVDVQLRDRASGSPNAGAFFLLVFCPK